MAAGGEQDLNIEYTHHVTRQIQNPYPPYKGFLIEKNSIGWRKRVTRAPLRVGNSNATVVEVYCYKIVKDESNDNGGTYVVLRFVQSGRFIFARDGQLWTKAPERFTKYPKHAEHINTTADPRVFLMKPHSNDMIFYWHGLTSHVITLPKEPNYAELKPLGKGNTDQSQYFRLEEALHLPTPDSTYLEGCSLSEKGVRTS